VDDELQAGQQKKLLGMLCSVAIIAVLIATLWPFDFFLSNKVRWLPEANGIQFLGHGLVVSEAPLQAGGIDADKSCSLEILVRPAGVKSFAHSTILNSYAPNSSTQLLVQQWRDDLLVSRHFVDAQNNRVEEAEFYVEHVLQGGKVVLLTMTSGPDGTVVYINGGQMKVFSRFSISRSDCAGQIVMGTATINYSPWPGEVRGLAVYSKALAPAEVLRHFEEWTDGRGVVSPDLEDAMARYAFAEGRGREIHNAVASRPDLEIPTRFEVPRKPLLESPRKEMMEDDNYVHDILVNIAGFVPLGFVICAYLECTRSQRQAIVYAILAAGILSFVIEVLQAYIPQRGSGVTDIITNTTGAALGAVLARPNTVRAILGRRVNQSERLKANLKPATSEGADDNEGKNKV
jgi:VanZ family protein